MNLRVGAPLDSWFLIHLGVFVLIGAFTEARLHKNRSPKWFVHALILLTCTYGWEIVEYHLSRTFVDLWQHQVEHVLNAWLLDPVANSIGYIAGFLTARLSWKRALSCRRND